MVGLLRSAIDLAVFPFLMAVLALLWLPLRVRRAWRRAHGHPPIIVWGPVPSIASPHWVDAVREAGYPAWTVVYAHDRLGHPGLFDYYMPHFFRGPSRALMPYATFLWVLCWADVFHVFCDVSGFLGPTSYRFLELPILRCFGKRVVAYCFGTDVQRASVIQGRYRYSIAPWAPTGERERAVLGNIQHTLRYADYVIAGADNFVFFPRYDLCAQMAAIDLTRIRPSYPHPRVGAPIRVVHAPNHRHLKGTEHVIRACDQLRVEGLPVELQLVEGVRNDLAVELYREADIVVDQLIIGAYGLFAIEAMALGKPVVCHLHEDAIAANIGWGECPIVNADPDTIVDVLRGLLAHPERLPALGRAGRAYVEKYHSYKYIGGLFDGVYRRLWGSGNPIHQ
jgi:hypothetical protein